MSSSKEAAKYIESLLEYGLQNKLLEKWDIVQVRNQLMSVLKISKPYSEAEGQIPKASITEILSKLLSYGISNHLIKDNITERDLLDSKIMAQLLPRQSDLLKRFQSIEMVEGKEAATNDFYQLNQASNYIRMDRVNKNQKWISKSEYGDIEITINLSKPEKDPTTIATLKEMPVSDYPKCLLCLENVGYEGRLNHPGRSNHRVLPVTLDNEQWYFQYSPYVYYNEHAIVFSEEHRPMTISKKTFIRLLDFVEQFPHYFIGSNADLPIVGGSILNHDHFQGGKHEFPMERAKVLKTFVNKNFENTRIEMLKWPLSVIRLSSKNKQEVIELSNKILELWRKYEDKEVDIHAFSEGQPHNTITPIARMNKRNEFEMDLALRNNRTTKEHPEGIFHPHRRLHHIKKENIGLIEVMGLAILPPRLKEEVELNDLEAEKAKKNEIGVKFSEVLECSGVFKQDERGIAAFENFINQCRLL